MVIVLLLSYSSSFVRNSAANSLRPALPVPCFGRGVLSRILAGGRVWILFESRKKIEASLPPPRELSGVCGLGQGKMLGRAAESPASSSALSGVFYTEHH